MANTIPYIYKAKIVNVVDGDTVDAEVDLGFKIIMKQRFRLLGVDTPELRGLTADKEGAILAKQYTTDMLLGKTVIMNTYKSDSFGRWLAVIEVDGVNFNESLIANGFAIGFMV